MVVPVSKAVAAIPMEKIKKIAVCFAKGKTMEQVKGDADYICNAGFYDMASYRPVGHLKAEGTVYAAEDWNCWGYVWNTGCDLRMAVIPDTPARNHLSGVSLLTPWNGIASELEYSSEVGGARPRTAMALTPKELLLFCTNESTTPEQLRRELYDRGAVTALMLDSGGSTQCDFGDDGKIGSSRRVHNYLAVWLKKEENQERGEAVRKKVCLDPGHGVETAGKCSPDRSYFEHEFALDVAKRCKRILERHGVEVVMTRSDSADVTLAERVKIANQDLEPDLFVSLHSNASGVGTSWTAPSGYCIYTSAAGEQAGRNQAAKAILAQVKKAGICLLGDGLFHNISLYVLRNTKAPAVLIEHGFHTNQEEVERLKSEAYRDKLAVADCKGILDYLGIAWVEGPGQETVSGTVCPWCGKKLDIRKG